MKKILAAFAIAILSTSPAVAGISCQGPVNEVFMEPNGDTYVSWGSWTIRICNQAQNVGVDRGAGGGGGTTIFPASCAALTSLFMTAKATGKQAMVYVDSSTCTFSGGYPNPYPYSFRFPQ